MAIFIDTDVFVALRNADDGLHTGGKELMKRALKSEFGRAFTSDYVLDEAITTALVRTKRHAPKLPVRTGHAGRRLHNIKIHNERIHQARNRKTNKSRKGNNEKCHMKS